MIFLLTHKHKIIKFNVSFSKIHFQIDLKNLTTFFYVTNYYEWVYILGWV